MDKNEDSMRSEEELDKIIPSPNNDNYNQSFSTKNEYKLNKVENEIDSFLNISDIKNDTNNNHFFADENINKLTKAPILSQNYIQINKSNNNNLIEQKPVNEKPKKTTYLNTNEIFNSNIKNLNNQNLNIKLNSNEKNNNHVFNNEKYKKIYRKLFLDDVEKETNILLSSISKNNITNLYSGNFTPNNNNKICFKNKLINKNYCNKKNEVIQNIKNLNYNTEISDINYIGQNRNFLYDQINKKSHKNNIYTLNEISENFDTIFNKLEAKIKNKQRVEFDLKKPQIRNNSNYLMFHSNKTSITDLNNFLGNNKKILTGRSNINNSLPQQKLFNENEKYASIKRTNIINLKIKSKFKLNYNSSRVKFGPSKINNKKNNHIYSYNNTSYNNQKRNTLNFDFDKNSFLSKLNKLI